MKYFHLFDFIGLDESQRKRTSEADRLSRFMQKYKKTVANLKMQQQQQNIAKKSFRSQKKDNSNTLDSQHTLSDDSNSNYFNSNDFASGSPVSANSISGQSFKDRYVKYKVGKQRFMFPFTIITKCTCMLLTLSIRHVLLAACEIEISWKK